MGAKVLLVVLAVLVILFAIGLGVGSCGDDGGPTAESPGWVGGIGGMLGARQRLAADDVGGTAACRALLTNGVLDIGPAAECRLVVSASKEPVRTLTSRLVSGGQVVFAFVPAPGSEGALTQRKTLTAGDTIRITIREKGGTLTIRSALPTGTSRLELL